MKKNYLTKATIAITAIIFAFSGCKKDNNHPSTNTKSISSSGAIPDGYTRTSVGLIADSNVTLIEDGYKLAFMNGHAYKMHIATGKLVRDLGKVVPKPIDTKAASNLATPRAGGLDALTRAAIFGATTQGAVTYASWQNPAPTNPITNFTASFTVPQWPTTWSNQLFAIWIGLAPSTSGYPLIQPLLIWGNSGGQIGGGQYYTLVNYVIWISSEEYVNGFLTYTFSAGISAPVHDVSPGTAIQAQISYVSNSGTSYDYKCQLVGYNSLNITQGAVLSSNGGGTVTAPTIPGLNCAEVVLEVPSGNPPTPSITSVYDYPAQFYEGMNSISITTGTGSNATHPTINWASVNGTAGLGEHTQAVSGSQVNLYFQNAPTGTFPVIVYTNDTQSIYFNLSINGSPPLNTYSADHGQNNTPVNVLCNELSNSTVIMTIVDAGGITPTSAYLYNLGAPIQGVFSNGAFTFSHINLTAGTSCEIVTD